MRVTNGMLTNTTLNGLYRSMNDLNKTYAQMTSGKKIQTVSDDPIIAGRALKLKTTVLETSQYTTNVKEANSWMEITDGALTNITEILKQIRTKVNQGATGTLEAKDKQAIQTEIAQLWEQLQEEANVTYNGRYVFSGYKTDEPLMITKDTTLDSAVALGDDLTVKGGLDAKDGTELKKGSTIASGSTLPSGTVIPAGTLLSAADAKEIFGVEPSDSSYFVDKDINIAAGTELTKETAVALGMPDADLVADGAKYTVKAGGFTIAAGTTINGADACEEVLGFRPSADSYKVAADKTLTADHTVKDNVTVGDAGMTLKDGTKLSDETVMAKGTSLASGSVLSAGTVNPKVNGKITGQEIEYQVGVNSTITVNTLGMDKLFGTISKCFSEIASDVAAGLDGSMSNADLSISFSKKLGELDDILADVSDKTSDLGSKVARGTYVKSRLTDQQTTFKNLLSEVEDIDVEEAYTTFNTQYATYQSALQATSKIITNTLADYL